MNKNNYNYIIIRERGGASAQQKKLVDKDVKTTARSAGSGQSYSPYWLGAMLCVLPVSRPPADSVRTSRAGYHRSSPPLSACCEGCYGNKECMDQGCTRHVLHLLRGSGHIPVCVDINCAGGVACMYMYMYIVSCCFKCRVSFSKVIYTITSHFTATMGA